MAIVKDNIITQGLRGKIGNLVFRRRGDKTTAYVQSPKKVPLSEKQKTAQVRFSIAVRLAVKAVDDPVMRKKFEKMAIDRKKESAYSAAISYFLKQENLK
jgi:hypothetical protein